MIKEGIQAGKLYEVMRVQYSDRVDQAVPIVRAVQFVQAVPAVLAVLESPFDRLVQVQIKNLVSEPVLT